MGVVFYFRYDYECAFSSNMLKSLTYIFGTIIVKKSFQITCIILVFFVLRKLASIDIFSTDPTLPPPPLQIITMEKHLAKNIAKVQSFCSATVTRRRYSVPLDRPRARDRREVVSEDSGTTGDVQYIVTLACLIHLIQQVMYNILSP